MCGIFCAIDSPLSKKEKLSHFNTIQHRGPDHSEFVSVDTQIDLGFHRLAINGLDPMSGQPMEHQGVWLIANAEIFNYKQLALTHKIELTTGSDCEIILKLYIKYGIEKCIQELNGEFAFVIYDTNKSELFAARDHLGIRGMYLGSKNGAFYIASEAKAIHFCDKYEQFPPRHYWTLSENKFTSYYQVDFPIQPIREEALILKELKEVITKSVKERMMSERKIGCLLSGGLDSSLITAIVAREAKDPKDIETFSIGMKGSPDLIAAQKVADHCGTTHHSIEYTEQQFIDALEETIYITGSFDITTIRASVGHQLVSNWINAHSDVKVVFSGETIDEMGSYLYFQNAPTDKNFQEESTRLLTDIHYFDMLRGDRSISSAGLEARVPFASKEFITYYMSIHPSQRNFDDERIEKYLVRKAFEEGDYLPTEVLWRRKNGFSDSVSQKKRSWSQIIADYIDTKITDKEYLTQKDSYIHNTPLTKEAYYYRKVFESYYGAFDKSTPYMWLPKWCGEVVDPSARVLSIYQAD